MKNFLQEIVDKFRDYRTKKFPKVGKFFLKLGVSANMMTTFSLLIGLAAVYFLFSNHLLFVILATTHLIADGLDGLIAKASEETKFGEYFDSLTDRAIALLILLKAALYLQDYYFFIILGLFILTHLIYFSSKLKSPVIFIRTGTLIGAAIYILYQPLLTIGYLFAGVFIVYSLALQLQWFVKKRFTES
jgi:phosphatidylglycerophosphate synthase